MRGLISVPWRLRLYRLGVLAAAVWLLRLQGAWIESQQPPSISLRLARKHFPAAERVRLRDADRGLHVVSDARGTVLGMILNTAPQTDHIIGYSGPSNLMIALDPQGAILAVEVLASADTPEHVRRVGRDARFLRGFLGWKSAEQPAPRIAAVSGATLTSLAMAEGIEYRLTGSSPSLRFPDPVTLEEVQRLFTNATQLVAEPRRWRVLDAASTTVGFCLRTAPQADQAAGYRGPTECLLGLAPDGRTLVAVEVRKSYDTESYVDQVRRADAFRRLFLGANLEALAVFQFPTQGVAGLGGATQTARGAAMGIQRRLASELGRSSAPGAWRIRARDVGLVVIVAGGLLLSATPLRGHSWVRSGWQALLVAYVGLVSHDLLSLALLGGWAMHGPAWRAAPGLVFLALAAFLVPWAARRQLYCHHICPHGALQHLLPLLLGGARGRRWTPPVRVTRLLEQLPIALLVGAFVLALAGGTRHLSSFEAFDAWAWRTAAAIPIVLAVGGLVACFWVPMAYCRFGCPTGALLRFVRSSGSGDAWSRRDGGALFLLLAGVLSVAALRVTWPGPEGASGMVELRGAAMGTTWSVKLREEVADPAALQRAVAAEFELAESLTSHWRTNTDLSIFNRTATTNAVAMPWPVVSLARRSAAISDATAGAFDITVGPLVRLWGFGPGSRRSAPPPAAEIEALRPRLGWRQLEVLDGMLRKQHALLELDLSSIAEGWAVDQVAQWLEVRGYTNFLLEAGGEISVRGSWQAGIEQPTRACRLTNEALSTSGTYRKNFVSGGRAYSHVIDPRTGRPVTHRTVAVSVRHASCADADAWSTALLVLGIDAGMPLAEHLGLAAQFAVETSSGRLEVHATRAWVEREARAAAATTAP
jgi:thiamine biosynthesis lipoprotein ApbE